MKSGSIRIARVIFVRESEQKNVKLPLNGVSGLSAHFTGVPEAEETPFTEGPTGSYSSRWAGSSLWPEKVNVKEKEPPPQAFTGY